MSVLSSSITAVHTFRLLTFNVWRGAAAVIRTTDVRSFIVLLMLALSACGENPQKSEKGDQGSAGPEGAPGPVGAAGMSGTVIRFVEIECRQICFVACKENERILNSYAINPGGTFTFDGDNRKATFRPQLQGTPVKVVLACVEK
jgi:hypothetical protein